MRFLFLWFVVVGCWVFLGRSHRIERRYPRVDELKHLSMLGLPSDRRGSRRRSQGTRVMLDFNYAQARAIGEAVTFADAGDTMVLAGGTELLNWMRIGIVGPSRVVDITRIADLAGVTELPDGGVRIGSLTKLNDAAQHQVILQRYPVLSQAILKSASAQIRNLATIGGNPLQQVRCPYFRAEEPTPCNRRSPGSGCSALHGYNEKHAIFGWTDKCVAVHPADPPVALAALDAVYVTVSRHGARRIPARYFNVLPDVD